jgi:adenylate cyclase
VRITAQLVDTQSGGHLWADRFDRELTDIFATQDEVVQKIVGALAVKLTPSEQSPRKGGTRSVEAYELWLRARQQLGLGTRDSVAQARAMHSQAIQRDPQFAAPHAGLAFTAISGYVNDWADDAARALEEAERWARRAVELDESDPLGHVAMGNVLVWQRKHDRALAELHRTIELDQNFAQGHAMLGMALMYAGRPAEALAPFATAMRLDPLHPNILLHLLAQTYFSLEEYEVAARYLKDRIERNPNTDASRMLLAACYGHLGRVEDARATWSGLLAVNPAFSLRQRARVLPYRNAGDFDRITEGLRKAGLSGEPG